jgi:hypothetical protein
MTLATGSGIVSSSRPGRGSRLRPLPGRSPRSRRGGHHPRRFTRLVGGTCAMDRSLVCLRDFVRPVRAATAAPGLRVVEPRLALRTPTSRPTSPGRIDCGRPGRPEEVGAIWVLIGAPPRDRDPGSGSVPVSPERPLRHPDAPVDAVPVRVPRTVGRSASAAHVAPDAIRDGDGVAWNVPASAEGPRSPIRVRRCRTAMCPPGIRRRSTRRSRPRKRV